MRLWRRVRQLLQRRAFEADLAEELRIHREMAEASAVRAGATPEEAKRETGRDFGSTALTLEDSRAVWRFPWLSSLMQDIRFGTNFRPVIHQKDSPKLQHRLGVFFKSQRAAIICGNGKHKPGRISTCHRWLWHRG